jgi:hypothetical protein
VLSIKAALRVDVPSGFAPECTVASAFLRPIFFASKKKALANRLAIARRSGDEELPRC